MNIEDKKKLSLKLIKDIEKCLTSFVSTNNLFIEFYSENKEQSNLEIGTFIVTSLAIYFIKEVGFWSFSTENREKFCQYAANLVAEGINKTKSYKLEFIRYEQGCNITEILCEFENFIKEESTLDEINKDCIYMPNWLVNIPFSELPHLSKIIYAILFSSKKCAKTVSMTNSELSKKLGINTRSIAEALAKLKELKIIDTSMTKPGEANTFSFPINKWMNSSEK